jgi:hypothetical protein
MKPWMKWGAGLLVLLALAGYWTYRHRQLGSALRAAEAAQLKLKGQIVADDATRRELSDSVSKLLAENDDLKKAYEAAKAAAPGSSPVGVATLSTGPIDVRHHATDEGPRAAAARARSEPFPAPNGHSVEGVPPAGVTPAGGVVLGSTTFEKGCLLAEGDKAEMKISIIEMKTAQNNRIVVGSAEAWRLGNPDERVLKGAFSAPFSVAEGLAPPPEPGWGAYLSGLCGLTGCGAGVGLLAPPLRFLGVRLEGQAGLETAGPGGGGAALRGQLGLRF